MQLQLMRTDQKECKIIIKVVNMSLCTIFELVQMNNTFFKMVETDWLKRREGEQMMTELSFF